MPPLQPLVFQQPLCHNETGPYKQSPASPEFQVNSPELQSSMDEVHDQPGQIEQVQTSKGLFARLIDVSRDEVIHQFCLITAVFLNYSCLFTIFQMNAISQIGQLHDRRFKSVNFGEALIKEMLFSSVFGVPLSINAALTAYRLMVQRVHRVATAFSPFSSLSLKSQSILLKHNADLVVSLRGAMFFEKISR